MSNIARKQGSSADFQMAARCRQMVRDRKTAGNARSAGNEARAQAFEKKAEVGLTGRERTEKARALLAQRQQARQAAAPAAPSKPVTPSPKALGRGTPERASKAAALGRLRKAERAQRARGIDAPEIRGAIRSIRGKPPTTAAAAAPTRPTPAPGRGTEQRLTAAASIRVERAFSRSPGADRNLVYLDQIRARLPGSRAQQDLMIRRARLADRFTLDSHEGRHGPLTPAQMDASIKEAGSRLALISRLQAKQAAASSPAPKASRAAAPSRPTAPKPTPATTPTRSRPPAEERIAALYRKTTERALKDRGSDAALDRAQARLDAAAARFARLPSKTQADVANRILGFRGASGGAEARRMLAQRHNDIQASTSRSREILSFDTGAARSRDYTPLARFPESTRARRAPKPATPKPSAPRPATKKPAEAGPVSAAARSASDSLHAIQRKATGMHPDQIDADVARVLSGRTAAEARQIETLFVGVSAGGSKKAMRSRIAKKIHDVRASADRSREILNFR